MPHGNGNYSTLRPGDYTEYNRMIDMLSGNSSDPDLGEDSVTGLKATGEEIASSYQDEDWINSIAENWLKTSDAMGSAWSNNVLPFLEDDLEDRTFEGNFDENMMSFFADVFLGMYNRGETADFQNLGSGDEGSGDFLNEAFGSFSSWMDSMPDVGSYTTDIGRLGRKSGMDISELMRKHKMNQERESNVLYNQALQGRVGSDTKGAISGGSIFDAISDNYSGGNDYRGNLGSIMSGLNTGREGLYGDLESDWEDWIGTS